LFTLARHSENVALYDSRAQRARLQFGPSWSASFSGGLLGEAVAAIEGDEVVHREFLGIAHEGEGSARVGAAEEQAIG
jgi:hypothetical protein